MPGVAYLPQLDDALRPAAHLEFVFAHIADLGLEKIGRIGGKRPDAGMADRKLNRDAGGCGAGARLPQPRLLDFGRPAHRIADYLARAYAHLLQVKLPFHFSPLVFHVYVNPSARLFHSIGNTPGAAAQARKT